MGRFLFGKLFIFTLLSILSAFLLLRFFGADDTMQVPNVDYNNALITITHLPTPDPYVIFAQGKYFLTFTAGDRVEIWCGPGLLNFHANHTKHVIWRPPPHTDFSGDLWAPELHCLQGRWYVYVAADNPQHGNKSHRMWVLGGPPAHADPCAGPWEFLGPIQGMNPAQWAIDGTVMEINRELYFVYSGWPLHNPGFSELVQELWIIKLAHPYQAASAPVRISHPSEPWERSGDHGINEGPQALVSPDGSWVGLGYSCAGSWTKDYKMATLQYMGGDPLAPQNWRKSREPLIQSMSNGQGPWGPGHGNFINHEGEIIAVFHATDLPTDGWNNRKARCQRVTFGRNGPYMGGFCGPVSADVPAFRMGRPHGHPGHGGYPGQRPPTYDVAGGSGGSLEDKLQHWGQKLLGKAQDKLRNL